MPEETKETTVTTETQPTGTVPQTETVAPAETTQAPPQTGKTEPAPAEQPAAGEADPIDAILANIAAKLGVTQTEPPAEETQTEKPPVEPTKAGRAFVPDREIKTEVLGDGKVVQEFPDGRGGYRKKIYGSVAELGQALVRAGLTIDDLKSTQRPGEPPTTRVQVPPSESLGEEEPVPVGRTREGAGEEAPTLSEQIARDVGNAKRREIEARLRPAFEERARARMEGEPQELIDAAVEETLQRAVATQLSKAAVQTEMLAEAERRAAGLRSAQVEARQAVMEYLGEEARPSVTAAWKAWERGLWSGQPPANEAEEMAVYCWDNPLLGAVAAMEMLRLREELKEAKANASREAYTALREELGKHRAGAQTPADKAKAGMQRTVAESRMGGVTPPRGAAPVAAVVAMQLPLSADDKHMQTVKANI